METSQEFLDRLVTSPSESLNVEVKRWIDPNSAQGCAKIAIACMALRNRDGGYLVIGFDDRTLQPDMDGRPDFFTETFHTDLIQSIISKYASVPFEVVVGFGTRPEGQFPVIIVGPGVRVPVASKRQLSDENNKPLIRQDAVYFRTLNANGVPSSSIANHADWQEIVEICFENREADFGRFLRRHGGPGMAERFAELAVSAPSLKDRTFTLLEANDARRRRIFESDEFKAQQKVLINHGSWTAMLVLDPPLAETDSRAFLNTVAGSNPQYTGWPVWMDSRNFSEEEFRPRKVEKGWDTILLSPGREWGSHADFYRVVARGEFYLWRALSDDMSEKVAPFTALDPGLMVWRIAETIAVGLAIAKGLGCTDDTSLAFGFRWEKLRGRTPQSWSDPMRYFSPYGKAHDDTADGFVVVPVETPADAIAPFVKEATRELFDIWDFAYPLASIEQSVKKLLSRTWA